MAGYRHEYSDILVDRAVAEGKITPDDGDLIKLYLNGQEIEGSSPSTRYNTFYTLVSFRQYVGEYGRNTIEELSGGVAKYKESGRNTATLVQQLGILRRFYIWLIKRGGSSIPLETVSHKIKVRRSFMEPDPDLSMGDLLLIINACKSSRDRAFVALLYDTGMRTKDACALTWEELTFDAGGSFMLSAGREKQGDARYLMATGYLAAWRKDYPGDASAKNFVFLTEKGDPFNEKLAVRLLGRIIRDSGIRVPVRLHSIKPEKTPHHKKALPRDAMMKKLLWEIR